MLEASSDYTDLPVCSFPAVFLPFHWPDKLSLVLFTTASAPSFNRLQLVHWAAWLRRMVIVCLDFFVCCCHKRWHHRMDSPTWPFTSCGTLRNGTNMSCDPQSAVNLSALNFLGFIMWNCCHPTKANSSVGLLFFLSGDSFWPQPFRLWELFFTAPHLGSLYEICYIIATQRTDADYTPMAAAVSSIFITDNAHFLKWNT